MGGVVALRPNMVEPIGRLRTFSASAATSPIRRTTSARSCSKAACIRCVTRRETGAGEEGPGIGGADDARVVADRRHDNLLEASPTLRSICLLLVKACSRGFRFGESVGRKTY